MSHVPLLRPTLATLVAAFMAGCAVTTLPAGGPAPLASKMKKPLRPDNETGRMASDGAYALSADELALNCRKLTGRMQVRILQVRGTAVGEPSTVARTAQSTAVSVLGVSSSGLDRAAVRRRDLALLEAYNRRLDEKNCPTFDLAKELQPHPFDHTPTPIPRKKAR